MTIKKYLEFLKDFLDIDFNLKVDDKPFYKLSKTSKYCVEFNQELTEPLTIYARKKEYIANNPDFYFALAHEAMHVWQIKNGYNCENYIDSGQASSFEEYNEQEVEIQANGFAFAVMDIFFHLEPQLPFKKSTMSRIFQAKSRYVNIINDYLEDVYED